MHAVVSATEDATKDQLVVATNAQFEPFEYKKGDNFYGIDMEIAKLFADYLGKELVIKDMVAFHPNTNKALVYLKFNDLKKLIEEHGNDVTFIRLF